MTMKLLEWRLMKNLTQAEVAEGIKVANASVISKYESGTRIPRDGTMKKIKSFTDGEVTESDFYGQLDSEAA